MNEFKIAEYYGQNIIGRRSVMDNHVGDTTPIGPVDVFVVQDLLSTQVFGFAYVETQSLNATYIANTIKRYVKIWGFAIIYMGITTVYI